MNISIKWLESLLGTSLDPREVADKLAMLGAPVDSIKEISAGLGDLIVGRVDEMHAHPDADKLSVCQVFDGESTHEVVCGAPNVRQGGLYPYGPVGAVLPGDFKLSKRKLRGVVSHGMLCSARELGLGQDHEGIMELGEDATPGTPLVDHLKLRDWLLEVDVTPNRPDLLSHRGIARELAAVLGLRVRLGDFGDPPVQVPTPLRADTEGKTAGVTVRIEDTSGCPRYMAAVIKGVKIGESPDWLKQRLVAIGARPISNVVDATNLILNEINQPMHAFDLDKLGGKVAIREPRPGEKLVTLDGVERELEPGMTLICDASEPIALGGVMGGLESEVTESTTNVLLECAYFEPRGIRNTRRALKMSTDASYRYERGTDIQAMPDALRRAIRLIVAVAGGELVDAPIDVYPEPVAHTNVFLRPERVAHLLGMEISVKEIERLLVTLGFAVAPKDGRLAVQVPGWRPDVSREVDLIEEIARLKGFDRFPSEMRPYRLGTVPDDPIEKLKAKARRVLTGFGLNEARSASFAPATSENSVQVLNPLSQEEAYLRSDLLSGLVAAVEHNWRARQRDIRLFEIGIVFAASGEELPVESLRVAGVVTGARTPDHWSNGQSPDFDHWDARFMAEEIGGLMGAVEAVPIEGGWEVRVDGQAAGTCRPLAADRPAWAAPVFGFELELDYRGAPKRTTFQELPAFPPVERDLALLLPESVSAAQVEETVRREGGKLLEDVMIFDEYRGESLAGKRSVAWRLVFRAPNRSLRDKDADKSVNKIIKALGGMGVELRKS